MREPADIVCLFDVDNTLIDNDRVAADLSEHLSRALGQPTRDAYWRIFEELRDELGYADYLGALQRYRASHLHDPRILRMANWLIDYPFAERLYPGATEAVCHLASFGETVILSDGDAVFQPRKVAQSGLLHLFGRRVLIYIHKEDELAYVEKLFPARHYVMIDDKLRLLDAIKRYWGERVTTVFPRQGHYAHDMATLTEYPAADLSIDAIGELAGYDAATLRNAAGRGVAETG
ncbi:MAG TPA: HAD family hydrolase [Rhizomicrobium sp.]|nr:HAD family hydrolase [Rhizomicrobium sp.]